MNSISFEIEPFFHQATNTVCYVVSDEETKCAAIIDSCLDYDHADGSLDTEHADTVIDYLHTKNLNQSGSLKHMYMPIIYLQLPTLKRSSMLKLQLAKI